MCNPEEERIIVQVPAPTSQHEIDELIDALKAWQESGRALIVPSAYTIHRFQRPPRVEIDIEDEP